MQEGNPPQYLHFVRSTKTAGDLSFANVLVRFPGKHKEDLGAVNYSNADPSQEPLLDEAMFEGKTNPTRHTGEVHINGYEAAADPELYSKTQTGLAAYGLRELASAVLDRCEAVNRERPFGFSYLWKLVQNRSSRRGGRHRR
jgi:hypothetical protein